MVATVGGGQSILEFTLPPSSALRGAVPEATYTFLRAGGEFRVALGRFVLQLGGYYRHNFDAGEVSRDFASTEMIAFEILRRRR